MLFRSQEETIGVAGPLETESLISEFKKQFATVNYSRKMKNVMSCKDRRMSSYLIENELQGILGDSSKVLSKVEMNHEESSDQKKEPLQEEFQLTETLRFTLNGSKEQSDSTTIETTNIANKNLESHNLENDLVMSDDDDLPLSIVCD